MKTSSLYVSYRDGVKVALALYKYAFQAPLPPDSAVDETKLQTYPDINQRQNISAPPAGSNVPGAQLASVSTQTGASDIPKLAVPLGALKHTVGHAAKDVARHEVKTHLMPKSPVKAAALSMDVKDITRRKTTPKGVPEVKKMKTAAEGPEPATRSSHHPPKSSSMPFTSVPPPVSQPSTEALHSQSFAPALATPSPTPAPPTSPEQIPPVESTRRVDSTE